MLSVIGKTTKMDPVLYRPPDWRYLRFSNDNDNHYSGEPNTHIPESTTEFFKITTTKRPIRPKNKANITAIRLHKCYV